MKTIIAGSRDITSMRELEAAIADCGWEITQVVSGRAIGVDTLGEEWANSKGLPIDYHPADWDQYGKAAGYRRNAEMAACSEALIVLWNGTSKGTAHMMKCAEQKGLKIHVRMVTGENKFTRCVIGRGL